MRGAGRHPQCACRNINNRQRIALLYRDAAQPVANDNHHVPAPRSAPTTASCSQVRAAAAAIRHSQIGLPVFCCASNRDHLPTPRGDVSPHALHVECACTASRARACAAWKSRYALVGNPNPARPMAMRAGVCWRSASQLQTQAPARIGRERGDRSRRRRALV